MNEIELTKYVPSDIIIVNKSERGWNDFYLESASLNLSKGKLQPGAFAPVSKSLMVRIAEAASKDFAKYKFNNLIKNRLLHLSLKCKELNITWLIPASKTHLYFKKKIGIESGIYPLPNLIFSLRDGSLTVFAVTAPCLNDSTVLYQAPFGNTYGDGSICWGNVNHKIKSTNINEIMERWEEFFFKSNFTHTNLENIVKGNLITMFKSIKDQDVFPEDVLLPTKYKLKDLLK